MTLRSVVNRGLVVEGKTLRLVFHLTRKDLVKESVEILTTYNVIVEDPTTLGWS